MDPHTMDEAAAVEVPYRSKPDGLTDPAGEAGWYLQRERERRGRSLEEISEATGIHPYHLDAIELGDLTRLPARLEALRMAGLYAQYLGFDPEPLVYHYAEILPRQPVAPPDSHPAAPAPLSSAKIIRFGRLPRMPSLSVGGFPGGAGGIVASCLGAVLLFAGASWMLKPAPDLMPSQQIAAIDDAMPTATLDHQTGEIEVTEQVLPDAGPAAIAEDTATAVDPAPGEQPADPGGLTAFIEENVAEPGDQAAAQEWTLSESVPLETTAKTPKADEGNSRLVLRAKAPVWVRIEDSRGDVVMTQMLMKGDSYRVPAREGLVVIARDGGLLSYEIDGKERGILGPPGEILVGRPLDVKALEEQG